MRTEYKFRDLRKATEVTHSQLDYWAKMGWVNVPEGVKGEVKKPKKTYSFENLGRIAMIKTLVDVGLEAQTAAETGNICKALLKPMGVDLDNPCSQELTDDSNNLYLMNVVNAERLVYIQKCSYNTLGKMVEVERSPAVSPVKLRLKVEDISKDRSTTEIDYVISFINMAYNLGDDAIDFKVVVNLNRALRNIFLLA